MTYYESEKSERLGFCQTSDFIQAPEMDLEEERIVENTCNIGSVHLIYKENTKLQN